ncbi:MAG: type IV toxin-antitoxin system AbiEi family antitoxin domain-containing protein [Promethearchaeota archaeon]
MTGFSEQYRIFKENKWYYSKSKHGNLISDYILQKLLSENKIIKMKAGLYRWVNIYSEGQDEIVDIAMIVPEGVFCLHTALYFHNLTSFVSPFYQIAIPRNQRTPTGTANLPLKIKKWKGRFFDMGIGLKTFGDYNVRVYNIEKTLCDCVRFRKEIGTQSLKEALSSYLNSKKNNYYKLMQFAEVLNVKKTMTDYCEMLI